MQDTPKQPEELTARNIPQQWRDIVAGASGALPTATVVILPEAIEEDVAVFAAPLTGVVKELRNDGVDAGFFNGPNGRTFRSTYSAEPGVILGILLNIFSNGAYDAIKVTFRLLRQRLAKGEGSTAPGVVTLRSAILSSPDGTQTLWQELTGPTDAVLAHAETVALQYLARLSNQPEAGSNDSSI